MAVNFNSYYLYKKYEKRGDQPWIPVYPETLSIDGDGTKPLVLSTSADTSCSADITYRWTESGTTCNDGNKYKNYVKEISYDGGQSWSVKQFVETSASTLVERNSYDCGFRTDTVTGTPYCVCTKKYVDVYNRESRDFGETWITASTTQMLVETGSSECDSRYCEYLTFVALEGGRFSWSGSDLSYSINNGETWSSYSGKCQIFVSSGDTVLWKSRNRLNNTWGKFTSHEKFSIRGNIMSIYCGDGFVDKTVAVNCKGLFSGLTQIISAENLILPATELSSTCYQYMFSGCTSLISTPELPATKLAKCCYSAMFAGCTSLTTVPELPATTLKEACYNEMFSGCTSLTTVPRDYLPAMNLHTSCYANMFSDCTSLTAAPDLPATRLYNMCYGGMFSGCISLTSAPELPATALGSSCYMGMFAGCVSLTEVPSLIAIDLGNACYANMFAGCTSLTTVPRDYLPATALAALCYEGMFSDCTSLTTAPELPATTITEYCYYGMFSGCTSLTTAPELPATTMKNRCYQGMFKNCTSLTTAPLLPEADLSEIDSYYIEGPYRNMFENCILLREVICLNTKTELNYYRYWLDGITEPGTFYKNPNAAIWLYDVVPSNWTKVDYTG